MPRKLVGRGDAERAEVAAAETAIGGVDVDPPDRLARAIEDLQPGLSATDVEIVVLVERQAVGIGPQLVDP